MYAILLNYAQFLHTNVGSCSGTLCIESIMKVVLLTVGKTNDANFIKAISEYQKRLKFYIPFEIIELPELKNNRNLSEAQQKQQEGASIIASLDASDAVVLLDDKGVEYTSVQFSQYMQRAMASGSKRLVFVVGGPYGFSQAVYDRANGKVSLSRMTFSHQMVRLVFVEQLYRAMTILRGEPYHHE